MTEFTFELPEDDSLIVVESEFDGMLGLDFLRFLLLTKSLHLSKSHNRNALI